MFLGEGAIKGSDAREAHWAITAEKELYYFSGYQELCLLHLYCQKSTKIVLNEIILKLKFLHSKVYWDKNEM